MTYNQDLAIIAVTEENFKEVERSRRLLITPVMTTLQKVKTENRLLTENNRRLKLAMMQKDPTFDFSRLLHEQENFGAAGGRDGNSRSPIRATVPGAAGKFGQQNINIKVNMTGEAESAEELQNMGKRLVEV